MLVKQQSKDDCCLLHKYDAIHCKMCWFRPMSFSLCRRGRWRTLSNALRKSIKTRETSKPFSMSWRMLWKVDTRAVTVDFPGQTPIGQQTKTPDQPSVQILCCKYVFHDLADHWEKNYWPLIWGIVCITWWLRDWDNRWQFPCHFEGILPHVSDRSIDWKALLGLVQ